MARSQKRSWKEGEKLPKEALHAAEKLREWREDPVVFVRDQFGIEPDPWQVEGLRAFAPGSGVQRIAFKSAKGPGKTALLAWMILNFLSTRPHPKCAATSITKDNLDDNLWPELAKWIGKSDFLKAVLDWTKTRITAKDDPENWFCSARTWPKSANANEQADTLAGLHADFLLFVLDEAGGIPDSVVASAEAGLATGIETKLVIAGNPTHLEGPLYRACTSERDLWKVIEITGDPDAPNRSTRISEKWAREQIKKYGRDNPWVLVNVFGQFPPSSMNMLLGPDEVQAAMARHLQETDYNFAAKRLGVDVARFGDDASFVFPRQGRAAFWGVELRGARTDEIAGRVAKAKADWGSEQEFLDATGGYGAGVEDFLRQAQVYVIPVNFSGRADDERYFNKRSEMWFLMAEWIKRGGALPPDDTLAKELTAPTYTFQNGRLRLEEKDQIKQRLGFSPNRADALALTFAMPDQPARTPDYPGQDKREGEGKIVYDYDPLERAR